MIVVKITALIFIITIIYAFFIKAYIAGNKDEALRLAIDRNYKPKYVIALSIMVIITAIGILASAIYLLFLR